MKNEAVITPPEAQGKMSPKARLTEIIVNAVILGLLVLSFVFSWFIPTANAHPADFDEPSVSFSPFEMFVGTIQQISGDGALVDAFVENGGKDLLVKGDNTNTSNREPSEEQILADVEFKRTYAPSDFMAWLYYDTWFDAVLYNINTNIRAYWEEFKNADREATVKSWTEIYEEAKVLAKISVADLMQFNYAGFRNFVRGCFTAATHDSLNEETVKGLRDTYLVSDVNFAYIEEAFADLTVTKRALIESAIGNMPNYADTFKLATDSDEVEYYRAVGTQSDPVMDEDECLPMLAVYGGYVILVFGLVQLLLAIPVLLRLLRAIKGQPRKQKKIDKKTGQRKKNKHAVLVFGVLQVLFLILSWIGSFTQVTGKFAGAMAGASVVTLLVNICLIAGEIFYMQLVKKNPDAAEAPEAPSAPSEPEAPDGE